MPLARIGGGVLDVVGSLFVAGGSGGLGIIPAVGLWAIEIDQIITGAANFGREPQRSVLELFAYEATGSEAAAYLAPAIGSLGIGGSVAF